MMSDPQVDPEEVEGFDEDVEFGSTDELMHAGISRARWERARDVVDARDVLFMLHNRRGSPMSCPFHGRDSKPSFYYFHQNNTCFCYGCPDGDGYWDNVKIIARTLDITRTQAVRWLEREFNLPKLEDGPEEEAIDLDDDSGLEVVSEETIDEPTSLLSTEDLRAPFVQEARRLVAAQAGTSDALPMFLELRERLFTSLKRDDPAPLARVVGAETVRQLIRAKDH